MSDRATTPEPLETALSHADDHLLVDHWMPPQAGIVPRVRIGRRWISALWALPIGSVALMVLIAVAQALRELPEVKAFIAQHPGIAQAAPSVDSGFPWWQGGCQPGRERAQRRDSAGRRANHNYGGRRHKDPLIDFRRKPAGL